MTNPDMIKEIISLTQKLENSYREKYNFPELAHLSGTLFAILHDFSDDEEKISDVLKRQVKVLRRRVADEC